MSADEEWKWAGMFPTQSHVIAAVVVAVLGWVMCFWWLINGCCERSKRQAELKKKQARLGELMTMRRTIDEMTTNVNTALQSQQVAENMTQFYEYQRGLLPAISSQLLLSIQAAEEEITLMKTSTSLSPSLARSHSHQSVPILQANREEKKKNN